MPVAAALFAGMPNSASPAGFEGPTPIGLVGDGKQSPAGPLVLEEKRPLTKTYDGPPAPLDGGPLEPFRAIAAALERASSVHQWETVSQLAQVLVSAARRGVVDVAGRRKRYCRRGSEVSACRSVVSPSAAGR